jgi:hypothetical protein
MVETSSDGEPTARHFGAQVKGRTAKPKNGQLKEKFETKHLRYYTTCRDPVFLFRIDPDTGAGNWLFIQRYLKQREVNEKLAKQGTVKIAFDLDCNLENKDRFRNELDKALEFMSDEFPGSPEAALAKRKNFLESLDSNLVIDLTATDKGVSTIINPKPGTAVVAPNIAGQLSEQQWKALNAGEPVTLKASGLTADTPLVQHLLEEAGDREITILRDIDLPKMSGSTQVILEGVDDFILQVNGEWTIAPTRLTFDATLPEAPLHLKSVWTGNVPANSGNPDMTVGFEFSKWADQPLLHLAYFDDLKRLFEGHPLRLRFLARGQQLFEGKVESKDLLPGEFLADSIGWLGKLRQAAGFFGVNPPFPGETEKLSALKTSDLRTLVALATTGKCTYSFTGSTFKVTGPFPEVLEPHPTELGHMKIFNQYKEMDFLGVRVNVGPVTFAWTDVILIEVEKQPDGMKRLKWKGSPTGRLTLDLSDPPPPNLSG